MTRFHLAFLAAFFCTTALAQTPKISKIAAPLTLTSLPMTTGGRVLSRTSASGTPESIAQWPGTYFDTAFAGTEIFFRVGPAHEILHLVVDGQPPLVLNSPEPGTYQLSGLPNGPHSLRVLVVTESQSGPNTFGGFALPQGEKPLPLKAPARQVEFIGDSHTVGYGNTSPTTKCTPDQVWASTDSSQAFGPLTAEHFGAAYQINAISGRGIVRNYNGFAADTLPVAYPFTLFDKQQRYNDPNWKPELIVIALGTNDFSTALNPGEKWKTRDELHADYEATYLRFLRDLRSRNAHAYLLLWATDTAHGEVESEVARVVQAAKASGESRIDFLPIDNLAFSACDNHPSLADDRTIEGKLERWIDGHPGIWAR